MLNYMYNDRLPKLSSKHPCIYSSTKVAQQFIFNDLFGKSRIPKPK